MIGGSGGNIFYRWFVLYRFCELPAPGVLRRRLRPAQPGRWIQPGSLLTLGQSHIDGYLPDPIHVVRTVEQAASPHQLKHAFVANLHVAAQVMDSFGTRIADQAPEQQLAQSA